MLYALVARYLGHNVPRNPNVAVLNMQGAGSVVAANWVYNISPKDGTELGLSQRPEPSRSAKRLSRTGDVQSWYAHQGGLGVSCSRSPRRRRVHPRIVLP